MKLAAFCRRGGDRQLSKKMLEHYSHQRLKAKGQMPARMEMRRKKHTA